MNITNASQDADPEDGAISGRQNPIGGQSETNNPELVQLII